MTRKELLELLGVIGLGYSVMVAVIVPVAYLQGSANAAVIKRINGIDIPWYQAAFVHVTVTDFNVELEKE